MDECRAGRAVLASVRRDRCRSGDGRRRRDWGGCRGHTHWAWAVAGAVVEPRLANHPSGLAAACGNRSRRSTGLLAWRQARSHRWRSESSSNSYANAVCLAAVNAGRECSKSTIRALLRSRADAVVSAGVVPTLAADDHGSSRGRDRRRPLVPWECGRQRCYLGDAAGAVSKPSDPRPRCPARGVQAPYEPHHVAVTACLRGRAVARISFTVDGPR